MSDWKKITDPEVRDDLEDWGDHIRVVKTSAAKNRMNHPKWADYDVLDSKSGKVTRIRYTFHVDRHDNETYDIEEK